ncbi:hypothetical protein, partial [Asaia bogorensis]|uniref:hypothetical protein n=1 Tax=Asaia bogorensis TaxID=91915 RepID=UPI001B7D8B1F
MLENLKWSVSDARGIPTASYEYQKIRFPSHFPSDRSNVEKYMISDMMDTAIFAVTPCFFQNKQSEIPADNT